MTSQNARTLVLAMGLLLAGSALLGKGAVLRSLAGQPSSGSTVGRYQRLWSVGVVVLVMSVAADLAPELVGPLAALVVIGWFVAGNKQGASLPQNSSPGGRGGV